MTVDLIYTDGLEALYLDGELCLVDEIIDIERVLFILEGSTIAKVTTNKITESAFVNKYQYEFPMYVSDINGSDYKTIYN